MKSLVVGIVAVLMLLSVVPAQAEMYVAGYGGAQFPADYGDVSGTGSINNAGFGNMALATTGVYGGKVGYFFPKWDSFGVEAEVFVAHPHLKRQTFESAGQNTPTGAALTNGAHIQLITPALNFIVRRPGERIQPYGGLGIAVVNATLSPPNASSSSDTQPALNLLIGLKGFVTDHVALFADFKYNYSIVSFNNVGVTNAGVDGRFSLPMFVGGVSWHF